MTEKQSTLAETDLNSEITTRRTYLKRALGIGTTIAAIPILSRTASAHFPVELDIDIQPENAENFIDLAEHDSISVAVHPSEFINSDDERVTFNPTDEPVRYRFGSRFALQDGEGARPLNDGSVSEIENDDDGTVEVLILEFPVADMGFDGEEETGWLYWERDESGKHGYAGVDSVRVYGTEPSNRDLLELLRQLVNGQN